MNCYIQKYTTHQFTYFVYYLFQNKLKNPKIIKIQELHQKIHTNNLNYFFKLFSIGNSFEFYAT